MSPPAAPAVAGRSMVTRLERRVLILAPTANDARLTGDFLGRAGLVATQCRDVHDLARRLHEGCGAILLAEEVLQPETVTVLLDTLRTQPSWSDIPLTLVCSSTEREGAGQHHLAALGPATTATLIERPFRPETLISMLEAALRSRLRQYQVRDLLAELGAKEARLRRFLEQTVVGLAETDLTGRFTLVNDRYCTMTGRSREQLLQVTLPDLTHPDDRAAARHRIEAFAAGQTPSFTVEKRFLRPDGTIVWVQDHLATSRDATGRPRGVTVASVDVTERKRGEEELARARDEALAASQAKDDFLASLSHELRTPLSPVLLLASEGARNPDLPATVRADFEVVARNVALEARLIDDLLDLTRITRGKLQLERRLCTLHAVLADALATVQADIDEKHLQLECRLLPASPTVVGDAVRLQQVFWNVLKNAVKFTATGGRISLVTRLVSEPPAAVVEITDTGIGMDAAEIARIFDAFVQGRHAGRRSANHFGGLGLGLAISRMLVELHGGRITAISAGAGTGSTFTIELPLAAASVPIPAADPTADLPPTAAAAVDRPRRILLVEDHLATRNALARLLRRRHFEVAAAGSVAEAQATAAHLTIDLIVSDIGLPDGTGYELMKTIGHTRGIKGIALTGYGMEQDILLSQEAGFAAHLTKPIRIEALDDALQTVLES